MTLDSLGQVSIWGKYTVLRETEIGVLTLTPDAKYKFARRGSCGNPPIFVDEGNFKVLADTIVLESKDSSILSRKFIVEKTAIGDTNMHLPGTLVNLIESFGFGARYIKTEFYSEDGFVLLRVHMFDKSRIHTWYFSDGRIRSVETYRKGKRNGQWYYYSADGSLLRIDEYRNNRLLRTETTAGNSTLAPAGRDCVSGRCI